MSLSWALWRLGTGSVTSRPLGVFRAAIGVAAVVKGVDIAFRLRHEEKIWWEAVGLPTELLPLFLGLWFLAALALLVGYRSRFAALTIAGLTAFFIRFSDVYGNHFYLLGTLALLLSLSDCGAYASLDSRRRGIREQVPRLPVTLIQIQISVVYLFSAIGKFNTDFVPGNVLFYRGQNAFMLPDLEPVAFVPLFMGMAVGAIGLELFIAVGLWFDRVRPAVFALGLALHTGMIVILSDDLPRFARLVLFAFLAFACYLLFVKAPLHARVVVWDDSCSFCSTWVRWFKRLDWLGAFRFVGLNDVEEYRHLGVTPESAAEAVQLVELDGRIHGGFEAVRRVLQVLPLTFLWAPYLGLRPVRAIGDRAYRAVAARRTCQIAYAR